VLDVAHIALDVAIDLDQRSIRGSVRHEVGIVPPEAAVCVLDAVALTIDGVSADGRPVPFVHDGEKLVIRPTTPWKRGETHSIVVTYHGNPERGLYFIAPDDAYPEKPLQAWTQSQDEDGRFWFPCVDHPSQKATTELRVRVPRGFEAISNGRLASRKERGEAVEFHWIQEVPHVTYLVSLVVGQFDVVDDRAGGVALRYWVPKGQSHDVRRTFGRTPEMIELFARLFGQPYPYPKYDQIVVSDFIFGGMENTSATVLYEYVMIDETVEGVVEREDLISHELAHQWFGDLITCSDWSHAWLNEGLATYAEILWYEHGESPDRGAYHVLDASRLYFEESQEDYRRPIVTHKYEAPVEIFDRHLYQKAACVVHHLRLELGDEPFFRGLRRYVAAHAGGLVETHDFRRAFEIESGRNLDPFFEQWVLRAGHPEIEVTHAWDESAKRLTLDVKQTQDEAKDRPYRFKLPCRVWLSGTGRESVDRSFEVAKEEQTFSWSLDRAPAAIRIGVGGVPLVRVKFRQSDAWLAYQLAHGDDLLGRIDAAADLGKSGSGAAVAALASALLDEPTWMGQLEIAKALSVARGAAAREALIRGLAIADARVRSAVVAALGKFREDGAAATAVETLLENEKAPLVRAAAYRALGTMRSPSAPAVLTKGLWEPSWNEVIGRACLGGLGALRDRTFVPLFVNSLKRGEYELRRVAAIDALCEAARPMEARTTVREELELLVEDPSLRIAQAAVRGIKTLREKDAVPVLERIAARRFGDPRLRAQARAAVKEMLDEESKRGSPEVLERIERTEADLRKLRDRVEKNDAPKPKETAPRPGRKRSRPKKGAPANPPRPARIAGRKRKMKRRRQ
jgi:aminopeptidase N